MEENERDGMSRVEFLYVQRVHAAKWDTYVYVRAVYLLYGNH